MGVKFLKEHLPASTADVEALQSFVREALPPDFVEFLLRHNGAEVETNIFAAGANNDCGVSAFLGSDQIIRTTELLSDRLPSRSWPIAAAECGNYIFLQKVADGWSYVFWDHELERTWPLANSMSGLLGILTPFGPSNVQLKPGQVVSAWIDPDLLK